ncbi:MAG: hypothetical protein K8S87_04955 [Planctomycetes bacterium]|nr:hypothetical protein [Planctomycetota bacterium]
MKLYRFNLIPVLILLVIYSIPCFAQGDSIDDIEIRNYPWESQVDYSYLDDASHFWNNFFKPGIGIIGLNSFEFQEFTSSGIFLDYYFKTHENQLIPILKEQQNKVIDYWSGVNFSGVVHKYVSFLIEGGLARKTEVRHDFDTDGNVENATHLQYDWDLTFMAEMKFGLPLNKDFTLISQASFRVWQTTIQDYQTYEIDEADVIQDITVDIATDIYIFRAQIYLAFEALKIEKRTSLNIYSGFGFHFYEAQERNLDVTYNPDRRRDLDFVLGMTFIYDNLFLFELKVIPAGVFSIALQISYLT